MAAPVEVSLPQTMLQKLLDLLKLESFRPHQEIAIQSIIHVIHHIRCQGNIDYHNQHERGALIGLFHATSSVLLSVESYRNYRKPTQRGVQGYLFSLQWRVRPVSLISNPCKGFSYIMNKRLLTYLEDQNILVEEQNGFRKGRNSQDHLFSLCYIIKKRIQLNMSTYCCFVDCVAAFDCVDRRSFSQHRHSVCG